MISKQEMLNYLRNLRRQALAKQPHSPQAQNYAISQATALLSQSNDQLKWLPDSPQKQRAQATYNLLYQHLVALRPLP
jgi:hypothetical protein